MAEDEIVLVEHALPEEERRMAQRRGTGDRRGGEREWWTERRMIDRRLEDRLAKSEAEALSAAAAAKDSTSLENVDDDGVVTADGYTLPNDESGSSPTPSNAVPHTD